MEEGLRRMSEYKATDDFYFMGMLMIIDERYDIIRYNHCLYISSEYVLSLS